MRILTHVAQRIINEVTKVINEEVIVMNRDGYIIAASDGARIGSFHEGGKEVVRTEKKLIISAEEMKRLRGVKIGLNLPIRFQRQVIGVIGITGSKPATTRHGELIQRMTELIIEEAYAAERLDLELRGLETFVSEWLYSETMTDDLRDRGEIFGINMKVPRYCVLIQLEEETELIEPGIELDLFKQMQTIFQIDSKHVLVRWGRGRLVFLPSAEKMTDQALYATISQAMARIEEKYSIRFKVGCSRIYEAYELHIAYKEAKQALTMKNIEERIVFYDSFTLELALSEIKWSTKKKIVEKVLGKLYHEQELLETLQMYFDHQLSIKETAAALHIHINTLHYRLKRIQELSGYQLKETKELVTLFIALAYYNEI